MPSAFARCLRKAAIIGSVLLLAACSTLRLAYNSAPQLAWWWVDGYLDLSSEQSPKARDALDRWFAWHRETQLDEYARWLAALEPRVAQPTTPEAVCSLFDEARQMAQPAYEKAYEQTAELLPQLKPAQLSSLQAKYAKNNRQFREEMLDISREKRLERSVKRTLERFEDIYGRLDDAQRRLIEAAVKASPFDPRQSLAEHEWRQREVLQALRRWLAEPPPRPQAVGELRTLAARLEQPGEASLRDYQRRLVAHNCKLTAELHNATSASQRAAAARQLKTWETDLRALAADRPARQTASAGN